MATPIAKDKLEKALERLEDAIEGKISALESENSKLRAEIVKLKSDIKKLSDAPKEPVAPAMPLTDLILEGPTPLVAAPQSKGDQLSDVHLSLSKLKRLVS